MRIRPKLFALSLAVLPVSACVATHNRAPSAEGETSIEASTLPFVREIDERYQSFQIGMSHLTGGQTWRAYDGDTVEGEARQAESFEAVREARAPTDLTNRRLHNLTAALAPLYIRYGGTTTNSVYFHDSDTPPPASPPAGFQTVLTRERWQTAVAFAQAVDAKIITGFTVSDGVRDDAGTWTSGQAEAWLAYTRAIGGEIYAAELYNEPNAREPGRTELPESAANYARDFAALLATRDTAALGLRLAGPGTATLGLPIPSLQEVTTEQYMLATPRPRFDIISYHFYGALAERCAPPDTPAGVSAEDALTEAWLARPDAEFERIRRLRDRYASHAPIWLTETGTAACGGTRWQPTFLDSFRFLDTHARLARQGLDVIVTHALISGSNGVIDERTFLPNADYWAALLWSRLMGPKVLDAGPIRPGLHVYAHCQRDVSGGVTVLAINLENQSTHISVAGPTDLYQLTATDLQSRTVLLNGEPLQLQANDTVPATIPTRLVGGDVLLAPTSISFIVLPDANNPACAS